MNKRLVYFSVLFLSLLLLISCAKEKPMSPDKRSVLRWEAVIAKNWEQAYRYETPAYRKNYSIEQYKNRFGGMVTWRHIRLLNTTYPEKNIAIISLDLTATFDVPGVPEMTTPGVIKERWIFSDGNWWYVFEENRRK